MRTPPAILEEYEQESEGLEYGSVSLILTVKMGKPRYQIVKEKSIIHIEDHPTVNVSEVKI